MNFALITEGASEHRVIKHIVGRYFKESDPEINQIQPEILNNKQVTTGGWNEVLKYCQKEELKDILVENDFLIIQIDTDLCQTHPFSVSHNKDDNTPKAVDELHIDVINRLCANIRPEILDEYKDKIFFAICVHSIECWLLPVYYTDHHKSANRNCLSALNLVLRRNNIDTISVKDKNNSKSILAYDRVLKSWRSRKDIKNAAQNNAAFGKFIESLDSIKEVDKL